jgi:hypothetical protein
MRHDEGRFCRSISRKGGKARTARFSAEQRQELARKAVLARRQRRRERSQVNDCCFVPEGSSLSVIANLLFT